MRSIRPAVTIAADSWTVGVVLALVVAGLPPPVRAAQPVSDAGPVEVVAAAQVEVAVSGPPPELAAPPGAALGQAQQLEASGRFAEAAQIYEAQWQTTADARFLYHAAVARSRAEHHAIALRLLHECLRVMSAAGPLPEAVRRHLEVARERELQATVRVQLQVIEGTQPVPASTLAAARISLRRLGLAGEPVPGNSFEWVGRPADGLHLDRGRWQIDVEVPGYAPARLVAEAAPSWSLQVQRRKVVVDLRFSPERALRGAQLKLRALDHVSPFAVERPLAGPTATVTLTPGLWQLHVRARRHKADAQLSIRPGQPPIDVALARLRPVDDQQLQRAPKLLLGIFGGFAATYVTGIGLLVASANREKRAERRDAAAYEEAGVEPGATGEIDPAAAAAIEATYPAAQLHRDLERAGRLHTAGGVVAGASIGAILTMLPPALRGKRRALVLELGLGGMLLAGGGGWLAFALSQQERLLADPDLRVSPAGLERREGQRVAASLFTGVGAGLVLFSGIALAHDAADRRKRARAFAAAPWAAPGLAGWSIAGRF
ncbi:hypothetical protein SAMN02745121_07894 [Nannocystis exedens]|uniref:Uncharacterized protein n=1 Tax=Nannocystis exedens TaxID=54 RepID=A0A1I2HEX6_9BACT|nr:hypothetical protein [Nannocystis exedens]PCC67858.1 hypothetical protein NAEX_00866 [Nannocystis exedens]SFF27860.1 hypothetical protein SAMN02745121_07894 [Nannocystis exedens]